MHNARKKKKEAGGSLRLVIAFCAFVFFLILGVTTLRAVNLYLESNFDQNHSFIAAFAIADSRMLSIVHFAPDIRSIKILEIKDVADPQRQFDFIGSKLKIPMDEKVTLSASSFSDFQPSTVLFKMLTRTVNFKSKLTSLDILRLFIFSKTTSSYALEKKTVSWAYLNEQNFLSLDKISLDMFADNSIVKENLTFQIINKTDISGLGSRLARLVNNIGANVVAVTTDDSENSDSLIIYKNGRSYTVQRLSSILGLPAESLDDYSQKRDDANLDIADIIIILDKDSGSTKVF